jgi:CheY-like chemotaxis protein
MPDVLHNPLRRSRADHADFKLKFLIAPAALAGHKSESALLKGSLNMWRFHRILRANPSSDPSPCFPAVHLIRRYQRMISASCLSSAVGRPLADPIRMIPVIIRRCGMAETKKATKSPLSSDAGRGICRRILVAEDHKATREIVSGILDLMGFEVALAGNGLEALSLFVEKTFDLVLTDLEMPIMDGWNLTRCIKERSPDTPVVLMTGADRATVAKKVERGSVDSILFKPFGLEDFERTVQGALESREGVLVWGYPWSGMNPGSAAGPAEHNPYPGQEKV